MRNYVTLSEEEKNSIKKLHSSFYNGYATLSPNTNEQPLLQDPGPSDTNGVTINNKGHVKTYTNHLVNESKEEDMSSIDMTVDALIDAGVNLDSETGSPSYPDEDITIYEEDMTEGETCEACGGEMMEGECLECGSKTMYEARLEKYEGSNSDDYIMDILKPGLEIGLSLADAAYIERRKLMDRGGYHPKSELMLKLKAIENGGELDSETSSSSYPDEDITVYEEDMTKGETCESCGGEMMEGECLECGSGSMYEEMDDELKESFIEQKDKINEMFNRMSKFS